jgi:hypothetical protein
LPGHVVAQIGGILASAMMVPMQAKGPSESQRQKQPQPSVASLKACMRTCDGEKKTASQVSVFVSGFRTDFLFFFMPSSLLAVSCLTQGHMGGGGGS